MGIGANTKFGRGVSQTRAMLQQMETCKRCLGGRHGFPCGPGSTCACNLCRQPLAAPPKPHENFLDHPGQKPVEIAAMRTVPGARPRVVVERAAPLSLDQVADVQQYINRDFGMAHIAELTGVPVRRITQIRDRMRSTS